MASRNMAVTVKIFISHVLVELSVMCLTSG